MFKKLARYFKSSFYGFFMIAHTKGLFEVFLTVVSMNPTDAFLSFCEVCIRIRAEGPLILFRAL